MRRVWLLLLLGSAAVFGQSGLPDPAFDKVPFDDWLKEAGQARIRWSLKVFPARLSEQQRMESYIWAMVDKNEFVKRPIRKRMVLYIELRDRDNAAYRFHRTLFLRQDSRGVAEDVKLVQHMWIMPGDYEIAAAMYDPESQEHHLKRTKLHVAEIPRDPLADAWRDLPKVEFSDRPSRFSLPVESERPLRVEVVVNEPLNRNAMSGLLPRLQVIAGMEIRNGSMGVTLLDLDRRKVSFAQEIVTRLDRRALAAALRENDPHKIDAHALENYKENAQFFVSEVRKRVERGEPADAARVLIILSVPRIFLKGENLRPIQATPAPGTRVFYIRCNSRIGLAIPDANFPMERPRLSDLKDPQRPTARSLNPHANDDSLAGMLKPLHPRLFDVTTPADFRNAFAAILNEISQPLQP